MKKILIIANTKISKKLIERIILSNTDKNFYDVIYLDENIIPKQRPSNFAFHKFDPTSTIRLEQILKNENHFEALISLSTKEETLAVIQIIRNNKKNFEITVLDDWEIQNENDPYLQILSGSDILSNRLFQKLPNIPVVASNIGLGIGEIMEIRIPFGSTYAYRYIGSIEQNEWHIAALYRNQQLVHMSPSFVLKPNDILIAVGKPNILMQIYNAINQKSGQFPMPFGQNLYLYLNLYIFDTKEILNSLTQSLVIHQQINAKKLIIKITRPTSPKIMAQILKMTNAIENVVCEVDYKNIGFQKLVTEDIAKYDIGMLILPNKFFRFRESIKKLLKTRIPMLKLAKEPMEEIKNSVVVLNGNYDYEQIAPVVFDFSAQANNEIRIINATPRNENRQQIIEHFENLSKILSFPIQIHNTDANPMRALKKEKNCIQILPLKTKMFEHRLLHFFYSDSDLLSFDSHTNHQLIIPIAHE